MHGHHLPEPSPARTPVLRQTCMHHALHEHCLDITHPDNAHLWYHCCRSYPVPPRAETAGRTEVYIGRWLASRKCRDKVILATKVHTAIIIT